MSKFSTAKLSSFYGDKVARPYVLLGKDGEVQHDRVDAPQINDALLEWAQQVPLKMGGVLVKPEWDGPQDALPKEPRTDFQIFFQERFDDVLAANPALFAHGLADRKALLSAASVYWRETLTAEERQQYRERATQEKAAAAAALAEAEKDPKFKAFRQKMQKYKESMHNILASAKASAGPLWRAQRRLNAKYRLLEEQQAAEQEAEAEAGQEAGTSGAAKKAGAKKAAGAKKRGGGKKGGKGAARALVASASEGSSSSEGEEGEFDPEAAEAAHQAAQAMQSLLLATGKKSGKRSAQKAAGAGGRKKAAAQEEREEEVHSGGEEAEASPAQRLQAGRRSRSGVAALAAQKASAGRKGGKTMYADAFELPPSQGPTPAKAGRGAAGKSPGKRTRATRHSAVAAEPAAEESPAKKQRRAPARR